jgi:invasion protein IalB
MVNGGGAFAQDVTLRDKIGNWSIYCIKSVAKPRPQDCSLVTAAVAEHDAGAWLKLGFTLSSSSIDGPNVNLTVKTPRLDYFKNGVLIALDGRQIGRAFIDSCQKKACKTSVLLTTAMRQKFLTAKFATFEYQVSETSGIAIAVNVEDLPRALITLQKDVGFEAATLSYSAPTGGQVMRYEVQLRDNPYLTDTDGWGDVVLSCGGTPGFKEVEVTNDLKIENDHQFLSWLNATMGCSQNRYFAVTQNTLQPNNSINTQAGVHAIYNALRQRTSDVVVHGTDGLPVQFDK